jgi:FkbH-like protein
MKLVEALKLIERPAPERAPLFRVALACGFEPLHLASFLKAHLLRRLPGRDVRVERGLFGDVAGYLERIDAECDAVLAVIEWPDLDARLGVRQLGVWSPAAEVEIAQNSARTLRRIETRLATLARRTPVVCALPTLDLPPFAHTPGWQAGAPELRIRHEVGAFALALAGQAGIRIINPGELDRISPFDRRRDLKAELLSGFPYQLPHADCLAELAANNLAPPVPKKGIITDLDDTLWSGILGECGVDGVHWDLDHKRPTHGLYQQLLRSLAESGVLVGVASKNDPELARQALERKDLLIRAGSLFPVEAGWGRKSDAVRRILAAWNISAGGAVFVDDSPMELAEVQEAFPDIECLRFSGADPGATQALLYRLRNLFGKQNVSEEDTIRVESLRRAWAGRAGDETGTPLDDDAFLARAEARITILRSKQELGERALELLNKTNQFNLNGERYEQAMWNRYLAQPDTVGLLVSYQDKFGPLGRIALLAGRKQAGHFHVDAWVMSCRAFSRRIEHACLRYLFDRLDVPEIRFNFRPTERNGPVQEILKLYMSSGPGAALTRELFDKKAPKLFHQLQEADHE